MAGWSRKFDEPITLPKGRQPVSLKDAGTYITKLPKAEHTAPECQAAMEALILVATRSGTTMLARIGIMKALNRHVERVFNPSRKEPHWGKLEPEKLEYPCTDLLRGAHRRTILQNQDRDVLLTNPFRRGGPIYRKRL
jgi:hypothetical protein